MINTRVFLRGIIFALAVICFPFVASANDNITIVPVTLPSCGAQSIDIAGTVTYSTPTSILNVFHNSVLIFTSSSQPSTYSVPEFLNEGLSSFYIEVNDGGVVLTHGAFNLQVDSCPVIVSSSPVTESPRMGGRKHLENAPRIPLGDYIISAEDVKTITALFKDLKLNE